MHTVNVETTITVNIKVTSVRLTQEIYPKKKKWGGHINHPTNQQPAHTHSALATLVVISILSFMKTQLKKWQIKTKLTWTTLRRVMSNLLINVDWLICGLIGWIPPPTRGNWINYVCQTLIGYNETVKTCCRSVLHKNCTTENVSYFSYADINKPTFSHIFIWDSRIQYLKYENVKQNALTRQKEVSLLLESVKYRLVYT